MNYTEVKGLMIVLTVAALAGTGLLVGYLRSLDIGALWCVLHSVCKGAAANVYWSPVILDGTLERVEVRFCVRSEQNYLFCLLPSQVDVAKTYWGTKR